MGIWGTVFQVEGIATSQKQLSMNDYVFEEELRQQVCLKQKE